MERRPSAYLRDEKGSALVPAHTYTYQLLPYERHLIEALGISEQEYRELATDIERSLKQRGFEYDHIPDIQNTGLEPFLIQIAIGLVLTGIGLLLAPKPQTPGERDQPTSKKLADQTGRSRFNNSVGFDAAPQLAQLASRIPIPFGRWRAYDPDPPVDESEVGETGVPSGGLLVEPLLVWSRMQSNGSFQSLKALMVVGQSKISQEPSVEGVMIGGQPIANLYRSNYAVFWSSENGNNRLYLDNLLAGDAAPAGNWDVPTLSSETAKGFSGAYSPANTTQCGCYESIYNGGHYRTNWRVISILRRPGSSDDPGGRNTAEIRKIAGRKEGEDDNNWEMNGIGRCYSNFCGLIAHNGQEYSEPTVVQVSRGDTFTYRIVGTQIEAGDVDVSESSGVGVSDINNSLNSRRERVDTLLTVGQVYMCNRTLMQVTTRPRDVFDPNLGNTLNFELKVLAFIGGNREVGLAGTIEVTQPIQNSAAEYATTPTYFRSVSWYPLHRVDIAQAKNTRPVEVTELGIRSQVWGQLNGLCNFNDIPTPGQLGAYNEDEISLSNGVTNKYCSRTSFFTLAVKKVGSEQGLDSEGKDVNDDDYLFDGFDTLNGIMFGINGNSPIDVYNFLRIKGTEKAQYEFRLIPKDACTIHRYDFYTTQQVFLLDISADFQGYQETTVYGEIFVQFYGQAIAADNYFELPELYTDPNTSFSRLVCTLARMDMVGILNEGNVGYRGGGYTQAYFETLLGQLRDPTGGNNKKVFGETSSGDFTITDKGVSFNCTMSGVVLDYRNDPNEAEIFQQNGTHKAWAVTGLVVNSVSAGSDTSGTVEYDDTRAIGQSWFAYYRNLSGNVSYRYRAQTECVTVGNSGSGEDGNQRVFERHGQIKELSIYDEKTNSTARGPEHSITYLNESVDNLEEANYDSLTMLGVKLRSLNQVQSFQQPQLYLKDGIDIERLESNNDIGPSDNFASAAYWMLTNAEASLGRELSPRLIDKDSFIHAAKFMDKTRLRFDGAVTDQVNIRTFLTGLAPLYLCNFVIKNGKFALTPAVPTDNDGNMITGPMPIQMMFTDSTIIDGTFNFEYINQNEREDFRAVIEYRDMPVNGLSQNKTIAVKWKTEPGTPPAEEAIDASQFVTRRGHAFTAARYLLSVRRRVDHTVKFKTVPQGVKLAPGDYFRINTEIAPYDASRNIVVSEDLSLLTGTSVADGTYETHLWRLGSEGVVTEQVEIKDGRVVDETLRHALMNIPSIAKRHGVYQVAEISLDEDGLVEVTGSHFPVNDDLSSKIVDDILFENRYEKFEVIE